MGKAQHLNVTNVGSVILAEQLTEAVQVRAGQKLIFGSKNLFSIQKFKGLNSTKDYFVIAERRARTYNATM